MEKKEYVSPSFEVTEMELGPVLDVVSNGGDDGEPAPPFTGSFDGSDDEDGGRRKARGGYQEDDDLLE
jgi:hypothetical protein